MESIFPEEIQNLRNQGVRFGEISCLADRRRNLARFLPLFVRVTHLMFQFATQQGGYQFVIAVHPKHGRFYERFFGFRPMSGERPYQSVQNKPAMAYSLDASWLLKERQDLYHRKLFTAEELRPQAMSEDELVAFRRAAIPLGASELLSGGYELAQEPGPEQPADPQS